MTLKSTRRSLSTLFLRVLRHASENSSRMIALHDTDREPRRQDDETDQPYPEHRGPNHHSRKDTDQGRVSIGRRDRGAISYGTRIRVPAVASQGVSAAAGAPMRICILNCIVPTRRK